MKEAIKAAAAVPGKNGRFAETRKEVPERTSLKEKNAWNTFLSYFPHLMIDNARNIVDNAFQLYLPP